MSWDTIIYRYWKVTIFSIKSVVIRFNDKYEEKIHFIIDDNSNDVFYASGECG